MKNVHKIEFPVLRLPQEAQEEDRGLKVCEKPRIALAHPNDTSQDKNDVFGVALICDVLTVELESKTGIMPALGAYIPLPKQPNAQAFVIDWRLNLINYGVDCYKVKVTYEIGGLIGYYYAGAYELMPYSVTASEGTVQIIARYNDLARELGINFTGSGFITGLRVQGFFGDEQINSEHRNLVKTNNVRQKVRNISQPTYNFVTRPLTRCFTRPLKEILLNASDLWMSDCNAFNHEIYKFKNVLLSDTSGIDFEGEEKRLRQISCVFVDVIWKTESKFDQETAQPPNISEIISNVCTGAVCPTLCELIQPAQWGTIKGCMNEGQIEDATSDLCEPCSPVELEINGVNEGSFAAGSTIEINLTDGTNPVTPEDVTVVGNVVTVELPAGGACPDVGGLYKSGLTTSLVTNDEGTTQQGDNPSFLRLNFINCFGNDLLLTGVLGGYQDESGDYYLKDGTPAANRAAAFPDEIIINHSTWRPSVLTVWGLAIDGILGSATSYANLATDFTIIVDPTTTFGGFTGSWLPANQEIFMRCPKKMENTNIFDYPPFNGFSTAGGNIIRWTGTRRDTGMVRISPTAANPFSRNTAGTSMIACMRKFTFDPNTNTLI